MAALTDLQVSSVERYLRELRHAGCIDPVTTTVGQRYRLNERGLRLMAAALHSSIQSLATSSTTGTNEDESSLVQRGQDVLRHVEHTAGIYSFFPPYLRLPDKSLGTVCSGGRQGRPASDGTATMGTRDLVAKFTTYTHYVTSREWFREKTVLPLLLIVAPGKDQEMRIARVVTHVLATVPGLVVRSTTATRLAEWGPLADIWYQVLPRGKEGETIARRRFYDVPNSRSA